MVNCTSSITEGCKYNLTKVFSADIVNAPHDWLGNYNGLMDGYPVIILLAIVAILLYLGMRKEETYDSVAAVYAGLITTFGGLMLFFIRLSDGTKLLDWPQLLPFVVLTGLAIIINYVNKKW